MRQFALAEHMVGINPIISRAVAILRSDKIFGPRLSKNTWRPVATFAEEIVGPGHVDDTLTIGARIFNVAMSKSALFGDVMTRFDGSNRTGVFLICCGKQYCYYFTDSIKTSTVSESQRQRLSKFANEQYFCVVHIN